MLSPAILVPAVLNGLMTGAVYALIALGLTLIYGVLHIINFAHGALLTAAMFAAFFAYKVLGLDPYLAAIPLTVLFFGLGYALQRFVIGPAGHGDDRNILLVTLGLAIVIENALLVAFRADTRTINLPYAFDVIEVGTAFLAVPRVIAFAVVILVALALWLFMRWTDTGKAIRAVAKEKLGAELSGIDVGHIYAVTFGLGTACVAVAACLLIPTYYVNPTAGNAFVLIAFTIVVLGGMGSVAGALIGRPVRRRGGKPVGPLSRRIARPDRHIRHVHPGSAVPPERPVRRAGMKAFVPIAVVVALLAAVPFVTASNVVLNFLVVALLIALVGQGWNLLGGYGGQYSFGHAAFFGTGAYATAILQVRYGVNAWLGFAVGIAAGAAVGAVIGALSFRSGLKGSYFALVTLAFAEVLRIIASVAPITGAGVGTLIKLDLRPEALQFQSRVPFYWIILGLVAVSLVIMRMIEDSRFGAYLVALRENEDAAKALGVNTTLVKLAAMTDLGGDRRRGRLLLRPIFPVHRCRHCLRPVDFDRGAARAHRRRRRHGVRSAARRARGQDARRSDQACRRRRAGARPRHLWLRAHSHCGFRPERYCRAASQGVRSVSLS